MSSKSIAIDTTEKTGMLFKVAESSGHHTVYRVIVGIIFDDQKRIGQAKTLEDALTLIKSSVPGRVTDIRIKDW